MERHPKSWHRRAEALTPECRAFIDGRFVDAASGESFEDIDPGTGRRLAAVASCDTEDVDRAVAAARRAFEAGPWPRTTPAERKRVLLRLAELVEAHREELALLETLDVGKPIGDSLTVDVPAEARCLAWYGEAVDKRYGKVAPVGPRRRDRGRPTTDRWAPGPAGQRRHLRHPGGLRPRRRAHEDRARGGLRPGARRDIGRAHRLAARLRAGVVWINGFDKHDLSTPFGGFKESGSGRDKSLAALDAYGEVKVTWVDLS